MKYIQICLLLLSFIMETSAMEWKYTMQDTLVKTITDKNKVQASVNVEVIDYFIAKITPYARQYPPHFENKADQVDVTKKLDQLSMILDVLVRNEPNNIGILNRAAFINNMAHNVNIKGTHTKAKKYYEKSLFLKPDSEKINSLYGMFLANTEKVPKESIGYLEKALKLGNEDARFTLGLLYVRQGKAEKGMQMLEQYEAKNPNNQHVKKIIKAIQDKKLTFEAT